MLIYCFMVCFASNRIVIMGIVIVKVKYYYVPSRFKIPYFIRETESHSKRGG